MFNTRTGSRVDFSFDEVELLSLWSSDKRGSGIQESEIRASVSYVTAGIYT